MLVSQHNPAFQDVASALTGSLDRDGNGGMRAALGMGSHKITALADGTDPTDAATVGQLSSGAGVPVGSVMDFAGSAAPSGWLVCGGQSLSRTEYAELFAVIGTGFGSLSGSTFSLPDCRGRVAAGRDFDSGGVAGRLTATTMTPDGTTLGATGGAQTVTLTTAQMPSHSHAVTDPGHGHTYNGAVSLTGGVDSGEPQRLGTANTGTSATGITIANAGGGDAHPNVQPTILFNKIIRSSTS